MAHLIQTAETVLKRSKTITWAGSHIKPQTKQTRNPPTILEPRKLVNFELHYARNLGKIREDVFTVNVPNIKGVQEKLFITEKHDERSMHLLIAYEKGTIRLRAFDINEKPNSKQN